VSLSLGRLGDADLNDGERDRVARNDVRCRLTFRRRILVESGGFRLL
jgi:hypothetical protein